MADGERQLWCAVIAQAVEDATTPLSARVHRRMEQVRSREWFINADRDFLRACALAGYKPDRIRTATMKLIEAVKPRDQKARVGRGAVANFEKDRPDQSSPSTQDIL